MRQKVYIFIEEDDVGCYYNLKQLTDNHPKVPYHTAYRALLKSNTIKKDSYRITIITMEYNTKRGFNKKEGEYEQ